MPKENPNIPFAHPFFCHGCSKATGWTATGYSCSVYADPLVLPWYRHKEYCAFNPPKVEAKKVRGRVGQQKQKKKGW